MANKGAAKEAAVGKLHALATQVFTRVLEQYISKLDELDNPSVDDFNAEYEAELEEAIRPFEVNPAMMGAITKFLKDNNVTFDDEAINNLSGLQQSLDARKNRRSNVVSLTQLKAVGDDG